jgi:hypothetical protein
MILVMSLLVAGRMVQGIFSGLEVGVRVTTGCGVEGDVQEARNRRPKMINLPICEFADLQMFFIMG